EPPFQENLVCERRCRDRSTCECRNDIAVALGSIVVVQDADGSGKLSPEEIRAEQVAGATNMVVGWSATSLESLPVTWDATFERVVSGFCLYEYLKPGGSAALSPIGEGGAPTWAACRAGESSCTFEVPELFCLW